MSAPTKEKRNWSFIALTLVVIGLLWMTLSGLCTAGVALSFLFSGGGIGGALSLIVLALMVGAVSMAIGLGVWQLGLILQRRREARPHDKS